MVIVVVVGSGRFPPTIIIGSEAKIIYWSLQELTGPVPMSH